MLVPIQLTGPLPSTFSSSFAVVHVLPVTDSYSIITTEAEFINQTTCFNFTNNSNRLYSFSREKTFAYLDSRSIGHYDPLTATQIISSKHMIFPSPNAALLSEATNDRLVQEEPALGTKDPYPWLDPQDAHRFQTDREILEQMIDLSQPCLTPAEKIQFYDLLEEYSQAFSLRDEIGLANNMQIHLELTNKTPFFI